MKETYWLAALNGIKCGDRVSHGPDSRCRLCGGTASHDRRHVFWNCAGAEAIRTAIQDELACCGMPATLPPRHLWLMLRPNRAIHHDLWRVVCLAAFAGMETGRRAAYAIGEKLPYDVAARIVCACAIGHFRAMLADYAALGVCRPAARASVAAPRRPFFFAPDPSNPDALALRSDAMAP